LRNSIYSTSDEEDEPEEKNTQDDICVEIMNSEFYFLIKNKVCQNDDNSIYDNKTNKMMLINKNGRQLWNGVMIGKIMVNLRVEALSTANMLQFPVLDPVLSNMTDSPALSWVHFNWGIIQRELKKFGAEMINQVKEIIVGGKFEVIRDVLKFLMNFER
jgi:hypothetical protein